MKISCSEEKSHYFSPHHNFNVSILWKNEACVNLFFVVIVQPFCVLKVVNKELLMKKLLVTFETLMSN